MIGILNIAFTINTVEENDLLHPNAPEGTPFYQNIRPLDDNVRTLYTEKIRKKALMKEIRKSTTKMYIFQEQYAKKVRTIAGVRTNEEIMMINNMKKLVNVVTIDGVRTHIELHVRETNENNGVRTIDEVRTIDGVRTIGGVRTIEKMRIYTSARQ